MGEIEITSNRRIKLELSQYCLRKIRIHYYETVDVEDHEFKMGDHIGTFHHPYRTHRR